MVVKCFRKWLYSTNSSIIRKWIRTSNMDTK